MYAHNQSKGKSVTIHDGALAARGGTRSVAAMTAPPVRGWREVRDEARYRIDRGIWRPGERIPNEAELAEELGCARATVNRALRDLALNGFLERRRRGGTRVAATPVRRAVLDIPIIRREVEDQGAEHGYRLLLRERRKPSRQVREAHGLSADADMLRVRALHTADGRPHLHEDRWLRIASVPEALDADFAAVSANEWLVRNVPLVRGEIELGAVAASAVESLALRTDPGAALFLIRRTTWNATALITTVRLTYAPGYRMRARL